MLIAQALAEQIPMITTDREFARYGLELSCAKGTFRALLMGRAGLVHNGFHLMPSRLETLKDFVAQAPDNPFARYGLAMELKQMGETDAALEQFNLLAERHPDYAAGFQQAGQLLLGLGRVAEARQQLQTGIAAAERTGDAHAAAEMRGLLDDAAR
jgi:tetratricopeptide (TPR) repeat protein